MSERRWHTSMTEREADAVVTALRYLQHKRPAYDDPLTDAQIDSLCESIHLDMGEELAVIVVGNPIDGIRLVGPFDNPQQAEEYAERFTHTDWWVPTITAPEEYR